MWSRFDKLAGQPAPRMTDFGGKIMKLKNLILGSVAAAGLSTAGFAADLGVLTSLDVCDDLGLSGLTISSDTNCLQISGGVEYEMNFGNYDAATAIVTHQGLKNIDAPGAALGISNDWNSKVVSWLKFVGTDSSDFGPARAVIKLKNDYKNTYTNGVLVGPADTYTVVIDEGYVQVGDATVLSVGKKGSIFSKGDDEPFNFTGLFAASKKDTGVIGSDEYNALFPKVGGHVIQLESNFGNGFVGKIGLESIDAKGTVVGVLDYAGDSITAHISGALDGVSNAGDTYAVHAGMTGTFDQFKLRAALSSGGSTIAGDQSSYLNGPLSVQGTFDIFTIAASAEVLSNVTAVGVRTTGYGLGGSVGATVTDGIAFNLGGRYFGEGVSGSGAGYQVAAQIIADVTETLKATAEIGIYGRTDRIVPVVLAGTSDVYGKAALAWAPGGGFTSSLGATVQQNGAYKVTFKTAKSFE
ncbi:MAG: porin [Candidatus Devosia symbiotica]|nr:porin [Candidatus Devosia symbiotica]